VDYDHLDLDTTKVEEETLSNTFMRSEMKITILDK
jgi:hypothetical protein